MKSSITLIVYIMVYAGVFCQETEEVDFPNDFFGIYQGTLHISSPNGKQEVPMEFHLQATDSIGRFTYTLVYGEGDTRQERRYTLLEKDKSTGEYVVDENNGIVLHDKVFGNRMYSIFEVNNSLLTTFITLEVDRMIFEIAYSNTENKQRSFPTESPETSVISYPVSTVQRAVLFRQ